MHSQLRRTQSGRISGWLIATIALIILFLAAGSVAIWAYMNYNEQKTNVDGKISLAVAGAKREQAEKDDKDFIEREKEPNRQFAGPDEYGRLSFNYPKTWSVYIAKDGSDRSSFEAYLNPVSVPPINASNQKYALRVKIENTDYERVIQQYEPLVKTGKLSSSTFSANGHNGTRIDGNFDENTRGSLVILRVRDKTISLRTDADTFKADFDKIISTINFNA